jgi:hypothetical protein
MAITVQEFLRAAAREWNEIKKSCSSIAQIDTFLIKLTEQSYDYDENEIDLQFISGFVAVIIPQIERTKQDLMIEIEETVLLPVKAEEDGFSESNDDRVTSFNLIWEESEDDSTVEELEDDQAEIATVVPAPVKASNAVTVLPSPVKA